MTTRIRQGRALSRGIDYLGDLGAKLRDLQGFATLAHELIQNADDAPGAGEMSFDVCEDALIVDNDGVFSDCGQIDADECPWKLDSSKGHRCDFHRFRRVASGDKRDQVGTIGAFGIGFISVLQVTDQPELISAGRHWILQEDKPENERILECSGCPDCEANGPRTRFILPWVRDPDTFLRRALRAPALTTEDPIRLLKELERSLPAAMLFLKKLHTMELSKDGTLVLRLERLLDGDSLIVSDEKKNSRLWHLLRGHFNEAADSLRQKHINRIEPKRSAEITLAIPEDPLDKGVFCAYLPTQQETDLPFHLNADFFPTSDRKRIILEADYQSEWNRAAIEAAATIFQHNLHRLPDLLGHKHLWHVFRGVHRVAEEAKAGHKEETLGLFWQRLKPELRQAQIFYTSRKEWKTAPEVLFASEKEEEEVTPILEGLGISLLHSDLRPFFNLFRSNEVGVRLVDLVPIADALQNAGLDATTQIADLPTYLSTDKARRQLRRELALLLKRPRRPEDQRIAEQRLAQCAVVPGRDKALWPCRAVYRADDETIALFSGIDPQIPFLSKLEEDADALRFLCPEFTPDVAVERLQRALVVADPTERHPVDSVALLGWFEDRREEVLRSGTVRNRLAALPIFPSSEGLKPLSTLSLPGDFTDPIGLAGVVDLPRLKGRRDFLRELGASELTFPSYASDHVPRAFRDGKLTADQKRGVIRLLAERLGEIRDENDVFNELADIPIVECSDGTFRLSEEVYFDNDIIPVVLGANVHLAVLPKDHESAVRGLYRWLGVEGSPRFDAITERIRTLTAHPPTQELEEAIAIIFRHLGKRFDEKNNTALMPLRSIAWLPARDDDHRWYRPNELYADYSESLFKSQANFLDVAHDVQIECRDFIGFLQIGINPTPAQVVAHLVKCSETGVPVNKLVYIFLNDKHDDPALDRLRDKRCLLLPDNSYVGPSQVFWGEHPFGRFRHRLSSDLRKYGALFARLGVRETPDHRDALQILREISAEYGPDNRLLDDETYAILMACWQRLDRALLEALVQPSELSALSSAKVVPDARRLLSVPAKMFFEDRSGLAAKFRGFLDNDVIPRPQGAWRAMEKAGVRLLSSAVRSHLVECRNPVADDSVMSRIQDRHRQLMRVVEPQNDGSDQLNIGLLDRLQCLSADELKIQYSVKPFNREVTSDPESLPAKFQSDEGILYFVPRSGEVPWTSIARELALAISPDADPGHFAAGIKEVLAAASEQAAGMILDELGFAPLEMAPQEPVAATADVDDLGGETVPPDRGQISPTADKQPVGPTETPAPADHQPRPTVPSILGTDGPPQPRPGVTAETVEAAIDDILGPGAAPPTLLPAELEERLRERPTGAGQRDPADERRDGRPGDKREPETKRRGGARGGYPVLRSYVSSHDPDADREVNPEVAAKRQAVSRAGLGRVIEHEIAEGRQPREMPPMHPGYDVESDGAAGHVERYIEVKSIDNDWEGPYAGLTATQFKKAQELGARYWLYVVEQADRSDFRIHRIQDPARRATQFMFDDGWKALAEITQERYTAAEENTSAP
jgi:hypothetical protein